MQLLVEEEGEAVESNWTMLTDWKVRKTGKLEVVYKASHITDIQPHLIYSAKFEAKTSS